MFKPLDFAKDYIFVWEDGQSKDTFKTHSIDRDDPGNWSTGEKGEGRLVGSNHGATARALAKYRKVSVDAITKEVMAALTLEEAAQIALKDYFYAVDLDQLPWDAVVASVFDFGWGAGQKTAIKAFQRMIGAVADGDIGPGTVKAYADYKAKRTLEAVANIWAQARVAYYASLNQEKYGKYMKGWKNRTMYFTPGTPWWKRFNT